MTEYSLKIYVHHVQIDVQSKEFGQMIICSVTHCTEKYSYRKPVYLHYTQHAILGGTCNTFDVRHVINKRKD